MGQGNTGSSEGVAAPGAQAESLEVKDGKKTKDKGKSKFKQGSGLQGGRFAKELRQHREAQEAKEAERQAREEEAQERNRKRKDHATARAKKAQLLAQKT